MKAQAGKICFSQGILVEEDRVQIGYHDWIEVDTFKDAKPALDVKQNDDLYKPRQDDNWSVLNDNELPEYNPHLASTEVVKKNPWKIF